MSIDAVSKKDFNLQSAFQLKGTLFSLHILSIFDSDLVKLSSSLENLLAQSPKFFYQIPLVLDCSHVYLNISWENLLKSLKNLHLMPIGLKNNFEQANKWANKYQLALFSSDKLKTAEEIQIPSEISTSLPNNSSISSVVKEETSCALFINAPVRSGQQIYAQGRDLVVQGPVSYGAELLADGHIHIYGPLRGRALAGVSGNNESRIYCHSLEAELVSIAGHYWLSDDLKKAYKKNVCIFLKETALSLLELE